MFGQTEPLDTWNDGAPKEAIVKFVAEVTREGGPQFVPPAERIAVIDNDGTLWAEQSMYFQMQFALDRVKALAPKHPEWGAMQPFTPMATFKCCNGPRRGLDPGSWDSSTIQTPNAQLPHCHF
ncbi:MAG TPA: hypothetical protein VLE25_08105 [Nitrospira sp.]|nr:hypothetical protein [Nitrospira sp.]